MAVDEQLSRAFELLQSGQNQAAESAFEAVLALAPEHPAALQFLGILAHMRGDLARAVELLERACALAPDYLDAHNNLGNIQLELGNHARAEACFRRVLELEPSFAATHFNLGMLLLRANRLEEAAASFEKAALLEPGEASTHARLGDASAKRGDFIRARAAYRRALELDPSLDDERKKLGRVYFQIIDAFDRAVGDPKVAIGYLDEWLELEPESAIAQHSRAAYAGESAPARASDAYVRATYDQFAESFDHVLGHLGYQGHALCAKALEKAIFAEAPKRPGSYPILDAGCGTGALGPLITSWTSNIVGVDLSSKMLARAEARAVYSELIEGELSAFLQTCDARFDGIVCADALIYFGDLMALFELASRALRPRGCFVFTVETALTVETKKREGFSLLRNGRYAHSNLHVTAALQQAGLAVFEREPLANLRREFGSDVPGLLISAQKN